MTSVSDRLTALRATMARAGVAAFYCADLDPHQSEYVAEHWQSRTWLSGFDGSAGTLVVTAGAAALWTDSRYYLQAEAQLKGTGIECMRQGQKGVPTIVQWLQKHLAPGDNLGLDASVIAAQTAERLAERLAPAEIGVAYLDDPLAEIWTDRPARPATTPFVHPPEFSDSSRADRLARLRNWVVDHQLDHYLVGGLDEIAWLLRIRGRDVAYNPLVVGFLLVRSEGASWFCGVGRVPDALRDELAADGVDLADYADLPAALRSLHGRGLRLGADPSLTPIALVRVAGEAQLQRLKTPVPTWKSCKETGEIAHLQRAMARDGVALLRLRRWLDTEAGRLTNEVAISDRLAAARAEGDHYFGESFPAIVGHRANGAIVHYRPRPETCATLDGNGMLLIDSGGQYLDGTTDITRTFHLGQPTEIEKKHFTLVLLGHIDLARAVFPEGTAGRQLDVLARQHLWRAELDYGHGTGHGVGYFLNVHEGPMGIRANRTHGSSHEPLRAGQILSNEPGYYREGEYGIRIENLVVVRPAEQTGWLCFEDLTLFPIERKLVDFDLLQEPHRYWLRDYHTKVLTGLSPLLTDPDEIAWLEEACTGW